MGDIKSAREIAMKKVEELGEPTEEERLSWKHVPKGEQLAAKYLAGNLNLLTELNKYEEEVKKYIVQGASGILIRNINLPKNDAARNVNRQAMDGLKLMKNDKIAVENLYSRIRQIFNHYTEQGEQQRRQAYESLKAEFEAKVREAVQQQMGQGFMPASIDVEKQPQFHQEWQKVQAQLDSQYLTVLDEYKRELSSLP
jgi:hypothetical protein